jgi:hypothetical protein
VVQYLLPVGHVGGRVAPLAQREDQRAVRLREDEIERVAGTRREMTAPCESCWRARSLHRDSNETAPCCQLLGVSKVAC